ncbi:D-xylulose 5-phosphate/D-fructose 6-phosphate phosphoketolase [Schizophyllum commune H4-8]|uniref:D-xylulose 5-phosphate/D-fructose 6-phosphate phosphoketolase n=1 Tax=Schizophyllum commune (strain H4-8 / FGSC 9210) TaxID=578458 RepID=UPI00215FB092|nr:D-xylulose 5-phosphate/D-fructose 6-phosphate phosphoketolase [Schizophyllum commune H4-8]KAI5888596.1 D-xylulose 5-phosphate/D-fructose 6-phosphate phosphoketolase [Schizophyllum commune H4-8]
MPGQIIYEPNPPPDPSHIPDDIEKLAVKLDVKGFLSAEERKGIEMFRRAADYIAAAMIFLSGTCQHVLLEKDLTFDDVKPRLLGHWGTCPGLVMVYAHLSRIIRKSDLDVVYVVGPGHGAPGILASLWLEGALQRFYPKYTRDYKGLQKLITQFSVPGGFPSHINAQTPGSIHEGGELGYALGVSFGAVMDNPDLIVACVVGDGEAESGPTATAWHGFKYIDPAESGAVLPIVHVNGFKISERTIYGTMDNKELIALFTGYGYQVRIIDDLENLDDDIAASMEWAIAEIHKIQHAARSGNPIIKPQWPVLILRTPKGISGPKNLGDEIIEGSFHSHQVPLPKAKTDKVQLEALNDWLKHYKPQELFDPETGAPVKEVLSVIPEKEEKRMGMRRETYDAYRPLKTPEWLGMGVEKGKEESCMKVVGEYLREVMEENPKSFRMFSPDELVSNKLNAVLQNTGRNFQWDVASRARGGRVIEILSEHTCQAMLQGYTLTGRTGVFPSYEAFLGIVHTMMVQYSKFTKLAVETEYRQPCGSLNYIETSTWARQEHNGFSHQNPSFIGAVLNLKPKLARVYLPPDANCFLSTMAHCLRAKNYINLMVGSKQPTPVWLSPEEADLHCIAGASVWKFASVDEGKDPDVVLCGIGVEVTFEVIAAAALLRQLSPALRLRVVNVTDLMILSEEGTHPHALNNHSFDTLFTKDRPIHFNYHGYPIELKGLLFGRPGISERVTMEGYREEGTTTSPFDMMLANHTSRFHVATAAVRAAALRNEAVAVHAHKLEAQLKHMAEKERQYIYATGKDSDGIYAVPKFE